MNKDKKKSFFTVSKLESTQTFLYVKLWEYLIFVTGYVTLRCSNWGWGPPPPSMSKRTLLKRAIAYCCSYTRPNPPITSVVRSGTHKQTCSWDGTAPGKKISTLFSLAFFSYLQIDCAQSGVFIVIHCDNTVTKHFKLKQRNSLQSAPPPQTAVKKCHCSVLLMTWTPEVSQERGF